MRRLRATGRGPLDQAIEATGGALTMRDAIERLGVTPDTLQRWRDAGAVLEVRTADGEPRFPAGQFERSGPEGGGRPFAAVQRIREVAGDALTLDELVGILAWPQPALAVAGRPRTGFQALADNDDELVVGLIRFVVTPPDADAPRMSPDAPIGHSAAGKTAEAAAPGVTGEEQTARLTRVVVRAADVFGKASKAVRWLGRPCRALGGAIPAEMLETEDGAALVERELDRIQHGVHA